VLQLWRYDLELERTRKLLYFREKGLLFFGEEFFKKISCAFRSPNFISKQNGYFQEITVKIMILSLHPRVCSNNKMVVFLQV
jgi:hypothetical protein